MMLKRIALCVATTAVMATAAPVFAQTPRAEVGLNLGWVFADGVSGEAFRALDGQVYDRVDPKDAFGWGFNVGVFFGDESEAEVGFLYGNLPTTLEISGTNTKDVGDLSVSTYHGYFAYNFGPADSKVRPYILGGFGATTFGDVEYTNVAGAQRTINGQTKYSSTWGAGVKAYLAPAIGLKVGARWTPAYIKSDAEGWWCDPYWGCYVVGDAQYANLFEFTGGITFRF